jgi:hypothetical protein
MARRAYEADFLSFINYLTHNAPVNTRLLSYILLCYLQSIPLGVRVRTRGIFHLYAFVNASNQSSPSLPNFSLTRKSLLSS